MIHDLSKESPEPLQSRVFDVCIAGAGPAGIAIALRLAEAGMDVALLEAGGMEIDQDSQAMYRGTNTGIENLPLHETRIRALGGSSNHWGGWVRPLDIHDFARADYDPDGSWPIDQADLAPYLESAAVFLGVNQFAGADLELENSLGALTTIRMGFSRPPAAIGEKFLSRLKNKRNLHVFLHAPVFSMVPDIARKRIERLGVRLNGSDQVSECRARHFILAMGAVENARRLMIWNRAHDGMIANPIQPFGTHYLQHLHQIIGRIARLDREEVTDERPSLGFFATSSDFLRDQGIGAVRFYTTALSCTLSKASPPTALCRDATSDAALVATAEHRPNPESAIRLSDDKDLFGDPLPVMDFRVNVADHATLRYGAVEFGKYLARGNAARLRIDDAVLGGGNPLAGWTELPSAPGAAGHQMGGLRMSATSRSGLVDRNLKLWSVENMHIAGSAVFRTSGHATPTLTIVQLALRLADHLIDRLSRG